MRIDLYRSPVTGALLRNPLWQRLTQWGMIVGLALLLYAAWGRERLPGVADPFPLIYTNAATLLFWVVWFMGLVLTAPLLGRLWCGVCPLGFISHRLGRFGLNLKWPRPVVRWLLTVAFFGAGVVLVVVFDAHKSPHLTAVTVAAATLAAVASGLVWRRAGFCGSLCPIGTVLSIYGRFAPLKVAPRDENVCRGCASHSCIARKPSWMRWDMGSLVIHKKVYQTGCPVALEPTSMDASECLICMECVRKCSNDNMGLYLGERCSTHPLKTGAALFLPLLAGLVLLVVVRTWPWLRDTLAPGAFPTVGLWSAWFGLALPLALILGPALAGALLEKISPVEVDAPAGDKAGPKPAVERLGLVRALTRIATPIAGVVLGAHAAVALVKLNAKAAYVPYLFYDPFGNSTWAAIHVAGTLPLPGMVVALGVLRYLVLALFAVGVLFGVRDALRFWRLRPGEGIALSNTTRAAATLCFAALAVLYGAALYHWMFAGRG